MKNDMKVLIAGSTGYLGSHIVKEMQARAMDFIALARNDRKLLELGLGSEQIRTAQVTQKASLNGVCDDIDVVISTIGITRQKDGLTYMDVDYQANFNLLQEAKKAGVKKFIYISAINGDKYRHLKIFEAKEKFVEELRKSGLAYGVVRPNGFFSDMKDFLDMAKKGKVYLFGNGEARLNPIHGKDLANFVINSIDSSENELSVGGPDIYSQNEIGMLALDAWGMQGKVVHLPDWIRKFTIWNLRTFTSVKTYGPLEFFLTLMAEDNVAPTFGEHHLADFYNNSVE